jgi:hypothetical protein
MWPLPLSLGSSKAGNSADNLDVPQKYLSSVAQFEKVGEKEKYGHWGKIL